MCNRLLGIGQDWKIFISELYQRATHNNKHPIRGMERNPEEKTKILNQWVNTFRSTTLLIVEWIFSVCMMMMMKTRTIDLFEWTCVQCMVLSSKSERINNRSIGILKLSCLVLFVCVCVRQVAFLSIIGRRHAVCYI